MILKDQRVFLTFILDQIFDNDHMCAFVVEVIAFMDVGMDNVSAPL